ncbi:MAG: S66 peptidase family protein [Pseudomonadota bacterium]
MLTRPKALKPGDVIGLAAPASAVDKPGKVDAAVKKLEEFGFRVKVGRSCREKYGYLSGPDEVRAEDINSMFADKEVDGIMCLRGGYGTPRILDRLDYDMIRKNPKVFVGYSDITAIHIALNQLCGLVTIHGPMPSSDMLEDFDDFSKCSLFRTIMSSEPLGELKNPPETDINTLVGGKCRGMIVGGNLSLIAATIGTPYEIDTRGKLLLLEEVDEEPYSIDRMLTQLRLSGKLRDCCGIILGDWRDCGAKDPERSLTLEEVFENDIKSLGKPAIYNFKAGHCKTKVTVPLGVDAVLDADRVGLFIEKSAVV